MEQFEDILNNIRESSQEKRRKNYKKRRKSWLREKERRIFIGKTVREEKKLFKEDFLKDKSFRIKFLYEEEEEVLISDKMFKFFKDNFPESGESYIREKKDKYKVTFFIHKLEILKDAEVEKIITYRDLLKIEEKYFNNLEELINFDKDFKLVLSTVKLKGINKKETFEELLRIRNKKDEELIKLLIKFNKENKIYKKLIPINKSRKKAKNLLKKEIKEELLSHKKDIFVKKEYKNG